jgi:hypothetical protein
MLLLLIDPLGLNIRSGGLPIRIDD